MKEIKFRVYGLNEKQYYYNCGLVNNEIIVNYDRSGMEVVDILDIQKNYILEQYTGITDVDGEYIYEGDIIRVFKTPYPDSHDENYFDVSVVMEDGCFNVLHDDHTLETLIDVYLSNYTIKVIGNVHERGEKNAYTNVKQL